MKKKILCLPLILLFLLSNCGFKLANQSTLKNYKIQDLEFCKPLQHGQVLGGNKSKSFTSVVKSDYNVSKKYAQTLTNEINTINVLTEKISDNIIRKLAEDLNDL